MGRIQSRVTLTPNQQQQCRELYRTMKKTEMAERIGVSYSRLVINMKLMGLEQHEAIMEWEPTGKYFNVDEWAKLWRF